jgi:hypothetical protein
MAAMMASGIGSQTRKKKKVVGTERWVILQLKCRGIISSRPKELWKSSM